ncbi:hypothetical protein PF003_g9510 [Phytophthora fragariae]|uniref:Uncharacterized protein n=1 Tax=Phytophthora fragariae TaxID=53985 RepID=A0A6A3EV73_9STRA|nr:hypothetical protein PF003_g9510 [Phytophthora fragariae]KAE8936277.1 hypothetical protein PF009_g13796 [Phytophthora fragariae]
MERHNRYFQQRRDATGKLGLSALQKSTAAIRQLAYGMPAGAVDEYVRIVETAAIKSLKPFCAAVDNVFGEDYLRAPTAADDVERLQVMHAKRGFVAMLGQYTGKESTPTIVLEAVVSSDLWFWHAFFGMPGSHNDINVLDRLDLFSRVTNMTAPPCDYVINDNVYDIGYYLADVENEREEKLPYVYDNPAPTEPYRGPAGDLETCTARHQAVRSTQRHLQLKTDLFIRDGSVEYPEFRANSQVVPSLMFSSVNKFMSVVVRHDLPCFLQECDGGGAGTMSEHARRGRLVSDA